MSQSNLSFFTPLNVQQRKSLSTLSTSYRLTLFYPLPGFHFGGIPSWWVKTISQKNLSCALCYVMVFCHLFLLSNSFLSSGQCDSVCLNLCLIYTSVFLTIDLINKNINFCLFIINSNI
jgi:hypothetical protein